MESIAFTLNYAIPAAFAAIFTALTLPPSGRGVPPSLPYPTGGFALFLKKSPSATGKIPWPTASKRKR